MRKQIIWPLIIVMGFLSFWTVLLWSTTTAYDQQTRNDIALISPPQQVLEGRVKSMSITTTTEYEYPAGKKVSHSLVVTLCSGERWEVPQSQINAVAKWLQSNLPPKKGCDD